MDQMFSGLSLSEDFRWYVLHIFEVIFMLWESIPYLYGGYFQLHSKNEFKLSF
jgi:hypothetical protein